MADLPGDGGAVLRGFLRAEAAARQEGPGAEGILQGGLLDKGVRRDTQEEEGALRKEPKHHVLLKVSLNQKFEKYVPNFGPEFPPKKVKKNIIKKQYSGFPYSILTVILNPEIPQIQ